MTATNAVADVAEEVAEQSLNVADASRRVSRFTVGAFFLGSGIGSGIGYLLARRTLETKYSQIADEEIAEMREHYQAKAVAAEATAAKSSAEEIVKERGYSSPEAETSVRPPMAVPPPSAVVEAGDEDEEPEVSNVFVEARANHEWDQRKEQRLRSPDAPYVIHYDERHELEDYQEVSLTYYEADDVLCNERDEIIDPADRDGLIGEKNLERFGHGSNEANLVYIRNDKLEILYEVVKSSNSYAEEVHGFSHTYDRGNLERMRARERDEQET